MTIVPPPSVRASDASCQHQQERELQTRCIDVANELGRVSERGTLGKISADLRCRGSYLAIFGLNHLAREIVPRTTGEAGTSFGPI